MFYKVLDVTDKPWGKEELLENNERYAVKRLFMMKGGMCSLQHHEQKRETIYVLSGRLQIRHGNNKYSLKDSILDPGDYKTIEPQTIHRMIGIEDTWYLESSTPELNDLVRHEDIYDRE